MVMKSKRKLAAAADVEGGDLDMDVDAFMAGGFEDAVLAEAGQPDKKRRAKQPGKKGKGKKQTTAAPVEMDEDSSEDDMDGLDNAIASHKNQLKALKDADPEFYKYLAESDKGLLGFGDDGEDEVSASDDEDGQGAADMDAETGAEGLGAEDDGDEGAEAASGAIDMAQVESWCRGAQEDASLGSIKRVMKAFRAACHYGDPDEHDDDHSNLRIMSNAAFQKILLFCLREADSFFRRLVGLVGTTSVTESDFKSSKWRKASAVVKSYMGNALHLLTHLAEEHTSAFILRRLRPSLIFLLPFESLQRKYLKLVLGLFGASSSRRVRLQAVLWLRAYALALPRKATDEVLKGAYRTYAAHARFVSPASLPDLAFMGASVVELYGINVAASYEHAFAFIAQLAVLLRNALTSKTVEAYRDVYCWRTVNCLELWGRVLATHAQHADLRPLVYPVAQLLLGAAKLVPSPRWFPIRLRLARILNALSAATGLFMPVAPLLLEVLSWSELSKSAKGSGTCPDLLLQLRLSKPNLKQPAVQDELVSQTMELLAGNLALWAYNPGYPELVHLPLVALKRFCKASPVERFRRQAKLLMDAIEANVKFVGAARDNVEFAPKDVAAVASFLRAEREAGKAPLALYATSLHEKAAAKRAAAAATDVVVPTDDRDDSEDEDNDDLEEHLLLKKKKASKQRAEKRPAANTEEHGEDEDMPDDEDRIMEYVVSDDEDEMQEDPEPQVVKAVKRKAKSETPPKRKHHADGKDQAAKGRKVGKDQAAKGRKKTNHSRK